MAEVKRQRMVVVRECLWELVGEDFQAAAILGQMIYWCLRTHDIDAYVAEEGDRMRQTGEEANVDLTHGWVYKTAADMASELLEIASRQTVARRLNKLVEAGWLDKRKNPRHKWDRTLQYRPNLRAIDEGLQALGYSLEDALPKDGWVVFREAVHSIGQGDQSDTPREKWGAHGEQSNAPGEQSNARGEQALPETITKITTETLNDGDPTKQQSMEALTDFGVSQSVARELAGECDAEVIADWLAYAGRAKGLTDPPAFVVAKLKAGDPAPDGGGEKQAAEGRRRYQAWAQRGDAGG